MHDYGNVSCTIFDGTLVSYAFYKKIYPKHWCNFRIYELDYNDIFKIGSPSNLPYFLYSKILEKSP